MEVAANGDPRINGDSKIKVNDFLIEIINNKTKPTVGPLIVPVIPT